MLMRVNGKCGHEYLYLRAVTSGEGAAPPTPEKVMAAAIERAKTTESAPKGWKSLTVALTGRPALYGATYEFFFEAWYYSTTDEGAVKL